MSVKISAFKKDGKSFSYMELKPIGQEKFGFFFDLSQAKLILNNMEEIQKFVEDNMQKIEEEKNERKDHQTMRKNNRSTAGAVEKI